MIFTFKQIRYHSLQQTINFSAFSFMSIRLSLYAHRSRGKFLLQLSLSWHCSADAAFMFYHLFFEHFNDLSG